MSEPTIGERLLDLKSRAGLSLTTIARQAGYSGPSSVQAFFQPAYDPPGLDLGVARKLARSLVGRGDPEITEAELFSLLGVPVDNSLRSAVRKNDLDTDVPVYETRRWNRESEGFSLPSGLALNFMLLNRSRPVRYYPRTAGLAWADGAFSMHVVGTSMSPRFEDGEPLFLSGSREPAVGDDVLVSIAVSSRGHVAPDTELVALGKVVGFEPYLSIRQYGVPYPKPIKLTSEQIKSVERISPWAEVCGLPYA